MYSLQNYSAALLSVILEVLNSISNAGAHRYIFSCNSAYLKDLGRTFLKLYFLKNSIALKSAQTTIEDFRAFN